MPPTPKPVIVWSIDGFLGDDATKVVLQEGEITLEMPHSGLGDAATALLYQSLTAARRARRAGYLNLK